VRLVTRNTDYAVRALIRLARAPGERVSSRAIAREEGIPLPYLRRILQTLRERGLIGAVEGKRGGWELKRPAGRISLRDLIGIFQGRIGFAACVFRSTVCRNRRTCPLRKRLQGMEERMLRELSAVTIGELMGDAAPVGGASRPDPRGLGSRRVPKKISGWGRRRSHK